MNPAGAFPPGGAEWEERQAGRNHQRRALPDPWVPKAVDGAQGSLIWVGGKQADGWDWGSEVPSSPTML